jgi:3-oxoacyl-[acyl-carrier protein] reductase
MQFADLSGKIALITGASRRQGIGAAICRALAAQGVDIAFTHWQPYDRTKPYGADEGGPSALAQELQALGVRAIAIEADLADVSCPRDLLQHTIEDLGYPHILVNNAAHATRDGYEQLDAAMLDDHYTVNVRGMALLSVEFARRWPQRTDGRIINFSSGQSLGPMPGELAYVASKGAVEAFTRTLAVEVAARGITVNAVDPGATDTGWMNDTLKADIQRSMRMGRIGQSEDAARLVVFLASVASAWITGQIIHSRGM